MNKTMRLLVLGLAAMVVAISAAVASPKAYRLRVDGLACPFCAYGIEKQLTAIDGVAAVETHIKDGAVIVTMKEGATLDEAAAKRAVDDAGFTLQRFEQVQSPSDRQD